MNEPELRVVANWIYTVTVVSGDPNSTDPGFRMRSRCWGYYFERQHAEQCIEENWTDISELGYYKYGVLAQAGEGPLSLHDELQWYEFVWDRTRVSYDVAANRIPRFVEARKIEKPEIYRDILFGGL